MTLNEFRITHSTLIEHYQYIETHLEGTYAAISDKPYWAGIKEVERGSLSDVIREIKEEEREKNIEVFTDEEYKQLRQIITRRNFWCHCCYYELAFDPKTGELEKKEDERLLLEDLRTAIQWRDRLFRRKLDMIEKKWQV